MTTSTLQPNPPITDQESQPVIPTVPSEWLIQTTRVGNEPVTEIDPDGRLAVLLGCTGRKYEHLQNQDCWLIPTRGCIGPDGYEWANCTRGGAIAVNDWYFLNQCLGLLTLEPAIAKTYTDRIRHESNAQKLTIYEIEQVIESYNTWAQNSHNKSAQRYNALYSLMENLGSLVLRSDKAPWVTFPWFDLDKIKQMSKLAAANFQVQQRATFTFDQFRSDSFYIMPADADMQNLQRNILNSYIVYDALTRLLRNSQLMRFTDEERAYLAYQFGILQQ